MSRVDARLVELSAETVSPAYIPGPDFFVPFVRDPTKHVFVHRETADGVPGVVELTDTDDLVRTDWTVHALAINGHFTPAELAEHVSVPVERMLAETPLVEDDFPVSFFKTIAVDPAYRSRGIGTELVSTAIAPLFEAPPIVVIAWLRESPANIRLVDQYSKSKVATFESYFDDDWECPECGFENPCTCDAEMYVWFGDERDRAVAAANTQAEAEAEAEREREAGAASH